MASGRVCKELRASGGGGDAIEEGEGGMLVFGHENEYDSLIVSCFVLEIAISTRSILEFILGGLSLTHQSLSHFIYSSIATINMARNRLWIPTNDAISSLARAPRLA